MPIANVGAGVYRCECRQCKTAFNKYRFSDFLYGEWLVQTDDGRDYAYIRVMDNPTFNEIARLIDSLYPHLSEGDRGSYLHRILGDIADPVNEKPLDMLLHLKCPNCGATDIKELDASPVSGVILHIPEVAFDQWHRLNGQEKITTIVALINRYYPNTAEPAGIVIAQVQAEMPYCFDTAESAGITNRQDNADKPLSVEIALLLLNTTIVIGLLRLLIMHHLQHQYAETLVKMLFSVFFFFFLGLLSFIVEEGKNWARISIFVLFICGLFLHTIFSPISLAHYMQYLANNLVAGSLDIVLTVLLSIAVVLLFRKQSSVWFTK